MIFSYLSFDAYLFWNASTFRSAWCGDSSSGYLWLGRRQRGKTVALLAYGTDRKGYALSSNVASCPLGPNGVGSRPGHEAAIQSETDSPLVDCTFRHPRRFRLLFSSDRARFKLGYKSCNFQRYCFPLSSSSPRTPPTEMLTLDERMVRIWTSADCATD